MCVHGGPGGQRDRLALQRARGIDRCGGRPAGGGHPRSYVGCSVTSLRNGRPDVSPIVNTVASETIAATIT